MQISYIDGPRFYNALRAGGKGIVERQQELNRINVFPVSDGDTGTNMAATIESIIEQTHVNSSLSLTAQSIAAAALTGARGNSGMILAQFFHGISESIGDARFLSSHDFVNVIKQGVAHLYRSISRPVEGTILTVIRAWADALQQVQHQTHDLVEMLHQSREAAGEALEQTTYMMDILRKNGVVDAGAKGFVYFLDGILAFIDQGDAYQPAQIAASTEIEMLDHSIAAKTDLRWRYCTEALMTGVRDLVGLRSMLEQTGDSVIVGGTEQKARIHLHTNHPAHVFQEMKRYGHVSKQKVDDMFRQNQMLHQRKNRIALVTDSTCDLSQELLDRYQIHVVPLTIQMDGNQYLDKLSMTPDYFYGLLDGCTHYPSTSQPAYKTFLDLYVQLAQHYDSVISIHVSQALSGTYETSQMAAQQVKDKKITVINSRHLSGTLGLLVLQAAEAIEAGKSHEEIVSQIEKARSSAHILVSVNTLRYMVRGGRVSPLKGWLGNALHLKPIVSLNSEGKSILYGKAFSRFANRRKIMKMLRELHHQAPISRYVMLHAHAAKAAEDYGKEIEGWLGKRAAYTMDISPAIGLHAGIGAVSVAVIQES